MKLKFHSPFLLLILAVLFSCKERGIVANPQTANAQKHLDSAKLQSLDTLKRLQHSKSAYEFARNSHDKSVLWHSFSIKYELLKQKSPDSAFLFLGNYLKDSKRLNDTLNIANAFYETAKYYNTIGKKDSAFKYFNASKIKYDLLKDSLQVAEKLLWQADIYGEYNDYIEMESATTEALEYLNKKLKTSIDTAYITAAYNNYGRAYTQLSNRDEALVYLDKAAKLTKDSISLNIIENNKGVAYMEENDHEKAIPIFQKLLSSPAIEGDTETKSKILGNLGFCYYKTGRDGAFDLLQQSSIIREETKDFFGQIAGYIHLSDYFTSIDKQMAKEYAKKAYVIATSIKSTDDRLGALQRLRENTTGTERDYYSGIYINTQDSIGKVRQKAKNQFAKVRYDASEASAENLKLKTRQVENALEIEKRKRTNDFLYLSIGFGIVTVILLYLLLKKKHRKEKMREGYKTEKRISKKVHDELANDVFNAMAFAETQDLSKASQKESLIKSLDSIYSRTRDISRENSPFDTGIEYPTQLREMLSDYNSEGTNVIVHGIDNLVWDKVKDDSKIMIYRVLQELMVNMRKHSGASIAAVRFNSSGKMISVDYSDNGTGMPVGKAMFKNGLQNVENRISGIGGRVTFDSEPGKGVKISVTCPA